MTRADRMGLMSLGELGSRARWRAGQNGGSGAVGHGRPGTPGAVALWHEGWGMSFAAGGPAAGEGPGMGVAEVIFGRLADGEVVIIDGGTGSQLQAEGVPMDDVAWSARANLEQPDVVQRVHEAYIRAGAEVIIANTFAASRAALEPAGLGSRVAAANRSAVRAGLRARAAPATRPVAVAGSMAAFCPVAMDPGALGSPLRGPAPASP